MSLSKSVGGLILCVLPVVMFSSQSVAETVEMRIHTWTDNPNGVDRMVPGDALHFQVGVAVDPTGGPPAGNRGLAAIVYDVFSAEAASKGYYLNPMKNAYSGWGNETLLLVWQR